LIGLSSSAAAAVRGAVDFITHGKLVVSLSNGAPKMQQGAL
jgi:hydroxyethylthiazole kinase-like sugar kinase family protein